MLKVIEERSVRRLGSTRSEPVDAAIIAATSENLASAVERGRFRADLYHRLAVLTLELPPLRARGRDIVLLAEYFLARACEDYGLPPRAFRDDARRALLAHRWPGNVRELANVIERAALLADEPVLTASMLGLVRPAAREAAATRTPIEGDSDGADAAERRELREVLESAGWNFTHAAVRLGVPRNTLRYRAERLGLVPDDPPERRRGGRPSVRASSSAGHAAADGAPDMRRVTLLEARLVPAPQGASEPSRPLEEAAAKVRSFGGQIQVLGAGALVAAFGLEPDEDAPMRAAYAALTVQAQAVRARERAGSLPQVALVLHTDAVPVTADRRVGDGAGAPARRVLAALLEKAEPGAVVASAAAARFLARRFELQPLLDGASRVIRRAEPRSTRFVGRERELRLLGECFALAGGGQGQVVLIAGEPGIGKSRLLHELRV